MGYARAVLIYNPAAGRRKAQRARVIERALEVLRSQIGVVEARPTEGPGAATGIAREACRGGADLVLVCGGDGTVSEAVNGLAHTAVPLAVLPAGTANVLAHEVGLPRDAVRAAEMLPRLEPRRIGLGRICRPAPPGEPRYFFLMAGIGFDARIVYGLNPRLKSRLGVLAYWLAGFAQLGQRLERFEVQIDGRRWECTFALATHSRAYGGDFHIARRVDLLAPELEIVLFEARSATRYLRYLAALAAGSLHRLPDVTFLEARRLEMLPRGPAPAHIQADGEYAGRLPATVEIVPDALTLLVPSSYG